MSLAAYLRDRWVTLAIAGAALMFCALILGVFALDASVIAFIVSVLSCALTLSFAYDFLRRRRFYAELDAISRRFEERHLIAGMIDPPSFLDGALAHEALQGASKSMNDRIASYRRDSEEYREYIETWVHEVKTPIAAATLICHNERNRTTEAIERELDRIEGCVEQALYYARSSTLERDYLMREVLVGDLVRGALRAHARSLIDAKVQPLVEDGGALVVADPKWCIFAIGQIVENAAKYRRPEGSAHLSFSVEASGEGTSGECVRLSICDDGIGMPAADVPRAFERGFTGENGRAFGRSTGMGLFLAKRLCDKMGLGIALDSEIGRGTRVEISFPMNRMYLP